MKQNFVEIVLIDDETKDVTLILKDLDLEQVESLFFKKEKYNSILNVNFSFYYAKNKFIVRMRELQEKNMFTGKVFVSHFVATRENFGKYTWEKKNTQKEHKNV